VIIVFTVALILFYLCMQKRFSNEMSSVEHLVAAAILTGVVIMLVKNSLPTKYLDILMTYIEAAVF